MFKNYWLYQWFCLFTSRLPFCVVMYLCQLSGLDAVTDYCHRQRQLTFVKLNGFIALVSLFQVVKSSVYELQCNLNNKFWEELIRLLSLHK
jgi:hypothetical protein